MKYVISLGGSLINPGKINFRFLKRFRQTILKFTKNKNHHFFIVAGGGRVARNYQQAARNLLRVNKTNLDRLGVASTILNAELVRVLFSNLAYHSVLADPSRKIKVLKKINIFCGWKTGWSTDYVAVKVAQTYGVETVINLSNVSYVYEADPRYHKQAKKYEYLTWQQFLRQFGQKWRPGVNLPFDPIGAALAQKLGLRVVVMGGSNLKNFENFLRGRHFRGTVIES